MQDLVPLTDEQAKALQEGFKFAGQSLDFTKSFGGYLAKILGTVPEDVVGLLGGDFIRLKRAENLAQLAQATFKILRARGIEEPQSVPLSVGIPLLQAASDEEREELTDLWAKLLAAAMDPKRATGMRQSFIRTIKAMDPVDALVLDQLRSGPMSLYPAPAGLLASRLGLHTDEAELSLFHLIQLEVVRDAMTRPGAPVTAIQRVDFTTLGRELVRILN